MYITPKFTPMCHAWWPNLNGDFVAVVDGIQGHLTFNPVTGFNDSAGYQIRPKTKEQAMELFNREFMKIRTAQAAAIDPQAKVPVVGTVIHCDNDLTLVTFAAGRLSGTAALSLAAGVTVALPPLATGHGCTQPRPYLPTAN